MLDRRWISIASAVSLFVLAACGDIEPKPDSVENGATNGATTCVLDTDCMGGLVCEDSACVATCDFDADCLAGETCQPRVNGPGTVCRGDDVPVNNLNNSTTGCSTQPDPTAFCEDRFGSGAFCDADFDRCVAAGCSSQPEPNAFCEELRGDGAFCDTASDECASAPATSQLVFIQDVTTDAGACEGVADPGSDIQGIELQDISGSTKGWGELVAEDVILTGNEEDNFGVIDGTAPDLDADGCVETFSGNVLSLGCTGAVAVEFRDASATPVPIESGDVIVVYEYGGVCSTGTTDDEFAVALCDDEAAVRLGDFASCNNDLGVGSGVVSFSIL